MKKKKMTLMRIVGIVLGWLVIAAMFLGVIALIIKFLSYII
jgi:hypothetical protein